MRNGSLTGLVFLLAPALAGVPVTVLESARAELPALPPLRKAIKSKSSAISPARLGVGKPF